MHNLLWGVAFVLVHFAMFLICYRLFGKNGLYAWIGAATILANIQVVKTIEMATLVMTLGNTMYATIYLTTDLLNEKYGVKEAKKAVWFGFFTLLMTIIIMQMAIQFQPHGEDIAQASFETLFGLMPQIALGSLTAYLVSQLLDVRIFSMLRRIFPKSHQLYIRNIGSKIISQLMDTAIFCTIAFATLYPWEIWWQIFLTTYLIKFVVSIVGTPFLYAARSFKFKEDQAQPVQK
ncbi:VUT family protein [Xylanibacillus composti]|uniref:Probable queuosine precursor transporter n=1 Tax=Xylanibacillus composti TaxID=1572762 RepID=A0A8J4H921_9BACL|nr:queuosine precursor transporter [Xylanibacillus composti]MDT9726461.1 VUT family protein [Xylanibacillus composti]GIQ71393.1 hypothetical protein XYCOK13_42170 [Xylanibacillus composti]